MKEYDKLRPRPTSTARDTVLYAVSAVCPEVVDQPGINIAVYNLDKRTSYGLQIAYIGPEGKHPDICLPPGTDRGGYMRVTAVLPGQTGENRRKHIIMVPPQLNVEVGRQPANPGDFTLEETYTESAHTSGQQVIPLYNIAQPVQPAEDLGKPHLVSPQSALLVIASPQQSHMTPKFFCAILS